MIWEKDLIKKFLSVKNISTESFNSDGIITHKFSGTVKIERSSDKEIIFFEDVKWHNSNSLLINSRNVYRWTFLDNGNIKLEHLRFGKDFPVFLVEFAKVSEHTWKSLDPHNCNNDLYSAELNLENDNPHLSWNVKGPNENYSLKNFYS